MNVRGLFSAFSFFFSTLLYFLLLSLVALEI